MQMSRLALATIATALAAHDKLVPPPAAAGPGAGHGAMPVGSHHP